MSTNINFVNSLGLGSNTRVDFNLPRTILLKGEGRAVADGGVAEAELCSYNTLNGLNYNALLRSASLIVTPNSYKEGKLYSVIPSNGNGDFTVTRATTATRTNSAGLVEVVPYNLLQYSEEFDNSAWVKSNIIIVQNSITAPNGTLTADKFVGSSANSTHQISQTTDSSAYGFSIYAKAGEETTFSMWVANASKRAEFNLALGTITLSTVATSSITDVGNGWYRCFVYDPSPTTTYRIYGRGGGVYLGNGTDGLYLWGAQAVEGTTAKDYQATTTRLNIPRLDYSLGGCPNLLLEPQRTNLALRSEEFDNAAWTKDNVTITANTNVSPSGIQNADTLIGNGINTSHYIYNSAYSVVSGNIYTISTYAKKNTNNFITLLGYPPAFGLNVWANFDLNNGVVGSIGSATTAKIEDAGNGWYRCSITGQATSTTSTVDILSLVTSATSIRGEVNALSTSVNIWGFQSELGSYATSYIPTTSASVTRNADSISLGNVYTNGLISASGGTWFVELRNNRVFTRDTGADLNSSLGLKNPTLLNGLVIRSAGTQRAGIFKYVGGSPISLYTTTTDTTKIAIKWNGTTADVFANGVKVVTAESFAIVDLPILSTSPILDFPKNINEMALWSTPLTDTQLTQLTTL